MSQAGSKLPATGHAALVDRVARLDKVREIDRAVGIPGHHAHVTGLRGSSPVFVIEALRQASGRPVVVCCVDEEGARDAVSDLGTVSTAKIELFPEKDVFPQPFELKENLNVRGRRNACLDLISQNAIDIVVTSLPGFLEKTMPPATPLPNPAPLTWALR